MGTAPPKSERKLMQVPLLDLRRQYAQVRAEILSALERVCDSQQFILGAEVAQFEKEVSATVGVQETVGCASGTDALWLALVAAGVQPGDSVITTPFSFFASAPSDFVDGPGTGSASSKFAWSSDWQK